MTRKPRLSAALALFTIFATALPCVAQVSFEDGVRNHLEKLTKDELPRWQT